MTTCPTCQQPIKTPRSLPDHRRFFGLIKAAYQHWPEQHEFQPDDQTHLRKWLLCKAGYRTQTVIPTDYAEDQPALQKLILIGVEGAVKAADGYAFVRLIGKQIVVFKAQSIKFDKLTRAKWGPLREAVEAVIEAEMDVSADELLRQSENAA